MKSKLTKEQKTLGKPKPVVKPENKPSEVGPKTFSQKEFDDIINKMIKENKLEGIVKAPTAKEMLVIKKKISTSEASNSNQLGTFKKGIDMAISWGITYNPQPANLKTPALLI